MPKLYNELAAWWPLLSAPADYKEEANFFQPLLVAACETPPRTLLELGSGGGNNASHLKAHFQMTLVDLSPGMLAVSRKLNPECEHFEGDMRTIRLGRLFDAVFIHDAIMYMTSIPDLRSAMETAFVHCRPGGVALFVPDHVRETFTPGTDHGGHDDGHRGLRYLEWTYDPDPNDATYVVDLWSCDHMRQSVSSPMITIAIIEDDEDIRAGMQKYLPKTARSLQSRGDHKITARGDLVNSRKF